MPQDFYGGADEAAPSEAQSAPEAKDPESDQDEMGQSAVIPKSLCPEMEAGQEIVLKIDKVFEDEYLVSYAPKKEAPTKPKSNMENAESGLERMAKPPMEM